MGKRSHIEARQKRIGDVMQVSTASVSQVIDMRLDLERLRCVDNVELIGSTTLRIVFRERFSEKDKEPAIRVIEKYREAQSAAS